MRIKHLLSAADLSREDATSVLDIATEMAAMAGREVKKLPTLRGRTVVNLFYEDSTRTRISFEAAAKRLRCGCRRTERCGETPSVGSLERIACFVSSRGQGLSERRCLLVAPFAPQRIDPLFGARLGACERGGERNERGAHSGERAPCAARAPAPKPKPARRG